MDTFIYFRLSQWIGRLNSKVLVGVAFEKEGQKWVRGRRLKGLQLDLMYYSFLRRTTEFKTCEQMINLRVCVCVGGGAGPSFKFHSLRFFTSSQKISLIKKITSFY